MPNETSLDTTSELGAQPPSKAPTLDQAKLFGFRNLLLVTTQDSDLVESSDLTFCKRGTEATGGAISKSDGGFSLVNGAGTVSETVDTGTVVLTGGGLGQEGGTVTGEPTK